MDVAQLILRPCRTGKACNHQRDLRIRAKQAAIGHRGGTGLLTTPPSSIISKQRLSVSFALHYEAAIEGIAGIFDIAKQGCKRAAATSFCCG